MGGVGAFLVRVMSWGYVWRAFFVWFGGFGVFLRLIYLNELSVQIAREREKEMK